MQLMKNQPHFRDNAMLLDIENSNVRVYCFQWRLNLKYIPPLAVLLFLMGKPQILWKRDILYNITKMNPFLTLINIFLIAFFSSAF